MTVEKILKKLTIWTVYDEYDEHAPVECYECKDVIQAMEEYAQQQYQKQLREEIVNCINWIDFHYDAKLANMTYEQQVDEYLKQKGLL